MPASSISITNGNPAHALANITEYKAVFGSPSQLWLRLSIPYDLKNTFSSPVSLWKIQRHKLDDTMEGTVQGSKHKIRRKIPPFTFTLKMIAAQNPKKNFNTIAPRIQMSV